MKIVTLWDKNPIIEIKTGKHSKNMMKWINALRARIILTEKEKKTYFPGRETMIEIFFNIKNLNFPHFSNFPNEENDSVK